MTIETLNKRIEGKQKAIATLEKKIARIEAAKASGWEKNPYYYDERDLEYANKDLETEKAALKKYQEQLVVETEKAASRNVPELIDFLTTWAQRTIEFMKAEKEKYDAALKEYYAKDKEFTEKFNNRIRFNLSREEIENLREEARQHRATFQETWRHVTQFNHGDLPWMETMEKDVEIEKNRKYDDIVERVSKIVGKITDANRLSIDPKGNLNGFIVGEDGKAEVRTISAEGPIQCFHFRTLIHEVK